MKKAVKVFFVLNIVIIVISGLYFTLTPKTNNSNGSTSYKNTQTSNSTYNSYAVKSLSIYPTSYTLDVGGRVWLTVYVNPSNATNKKVTYSSKNANIAIISATGQITALAVGSTQIVVTSQENSSIKAYCNITVKRSVHYYNISYDLNGGTVNNSNPTRYNDNETITLKNPQKQGYNFIGWTGSNGSSPETNVTISKGSTEDKYYTANWEPINYNISYNLNGGTFNETPKTTYNIEDNFSLIRPYKNGYNFIGWTLDNSGSTSTISSITTGTVGNKSFTANWELIEYSISYNLNGGALENQMSKYNVTQRFNLQTPTRNGYIFLGWTGDNGSTPAKNITINFGTTGNKYYTANWSIATYTILYNLDGGQEDTNLESYTVNTPNFTLSNPTKTGYTFIGWTGSNGETLSLNVTVNTCDAENKYFNANWQINQYTISFDTNGGSEIPSITQDYNSNITAPTKPILNKKSLENWYIDSNFNEVFTFNKMPATNLTLYAKWISYEIKINYNENINYISEYGEINSTIFGATALDTDGNEFDVSATIISGTRAAGNNVTVRLSTTGLYGEFDRITLQNIKVYGLPTITYDTDKNYINITDTLNANLFSANAIDTYNTPLIVVVSAKEKNYNSGDLITIVISAEDVTGNIKNVEIENIRVYGLLNISTSKSKVKAQDTSIITGEMIGLNISDSFGDDCEQYSISWTPNYSKVVTKYTNYVDDGQHTVYPNSSESIIFTALKTETYKLRVWNPARVTSSCSVKNLSTLSTLLSTSVSYSYDSHSYSRLFNLDVTAGVQYEIIITMNSNGRTCFMLSSGTQTIDESLKSLIHEAGNLVSTTITATDCKGNVSTYQTNLQICGTPTISNATNLNFKLSENVSIEKLGVVCLDDFGDKIDDVNITLVDGYYGPGNLLTCLITATDTVGNVATKEISNIRIYHIPTLEYNTNKQAISTTDAISASLLNASAIDSFGQNIVVDVTINSGGLIKGGIITLKLKATDAAGNIYETVSQDMLVYSNEISINYNQVGVDFIKKSSSGEEFEATALDCFGNNVSIELIIVTGELAGGEIVTLKLIAQDAAGNVAQSDIIKNIKIYDTPQVEFLRNENYILESEQDYSALFIVRDSFEKELIPSFEIVEGVQTAGGSIKLKVYGIDRANNYYEGIYQLEVR